MPFFVEPIEVTPATQRGPELAVRRHRTRSGRHCKLLANVAVVAVVLR